jgi:hypothetical protein
VTRRRKTPAPKDAYTLVDELMASPTAPMSAADAAVRVNAARRALEHIQTADKPAVMDWRTCAMVGNVIEVMLERGSAQDPDGLLADAQRALRQASERAIREGVPIRLTGPGLTAVTWMIDSFEEMLAVAPHRMMIRAFRETDKRIRELDRGARRPGDYIIKRTGGAK